MVNRMSMKKKLTAVAALTMAAALGACGSVGPSGEDGEMQEITMGLVPTVDAAPFMYAVNEGIMEKHGLDVEVRMTTGGAAAIPALVAGDFDFIYSAYTGLIQARQRGFEVIAVSGSHSSTTSETTPDGLWTNPDSGITSIDDLKGEVISVNTLGSFAHLMVLATLEDRGIDESEVDIIEVPFPDVPAALSQNRVAAAWVSEPSRARIINDLDAKFVGSVDDPTRMTTAEALQDMPVSGYAARADTDPEILQAFYEAMEESKAEFEGNDDLALEVASTYVDFPEELKEHIVVSDFGPVTVEDLTRLEDLMVQYGILSEASGTIEGSVYQPQQ